MSTDKLDLFEGAKAAVAIRGKTAYITLALKDGRVLNINGNTGNPASEILSDEFW